MRQASSLPPAPSIIHHLLQASSTTCRMHLPQPSTKHHPPTMPSGYCANYTKHGSSTCTKHHPTKVNQASLIYCTEHHPPPAPSIIHHLHQASSTTCTKHRIHNLQSRIIHHSDPRIIHHLNQASSTICISKFHPARVPSIIHNLHQASSTT